jgi:cell division protein FtsZ
MSTGYGEGEGRVSKAIDEAIKSPLLNNNDIFNSKKVLLNINFSDAEESQQFTMEEMNEVHNFMSKFSKEVEVKWGMATDAVLGNKIKITLLATGFGLQSVPGMEERLEERSEHDSEAERERREHEAELRGQYYGTEGGKNLPRRHRHIFIFTPDALDNEDIIARVEETPTYRRTKDELAQINNLVEPSVVESAPAQQSESESPNETSAQSSALQQDSETGFVGFTLD